MGPVVLPPAVTVHGPRGQVLGYLERRPVGGLIVRDCHGAALGYQGTSGDVYDRSGSPLPGRNPHLLLKASPCR